MNFNSTIRRFRVIGISEGISYLLLLLIGMPLKYKMGIPEAVKVMGWIHGVLFILYIIVLVQVKISNKWPLLRTLIAFAASLIPFGTFVLDKKLREEEIKTQEQTIAPKK